MVVSVSDVPATEAQERLVKAWASLAEHCVELLMSHHTCCGHAGSRRGQPDDGCFRVSVGSTCEQAATGVPGEIRVGMQPSTGVAFAPLLPLGLELIVAGTDPNTPATAYHASYHLSAPGSDVVLVQTSTQNPRGLYLGRVGSASAGSPVVIYLDGL